MPARSLRRELLGWVMIPLIAVACFNVWTTYRNALAAADLITERTLIASARVIAEQIRDDDGVLDAPIPPAALEMFAFDRPDLVVYQVVGPDGTLLAGTPEVARPPRLPADREPVYFDARFRGASIRAVSIVQPLVLRTGTVNLVVMVGQTLSRRNDLVSRLWQKALRDQSLIVLGAGLLSLFGLSRGLAPLMRLRDLLRRPGTADPIELPEHSVQLELQPLVRALNTALADVQRQVATQRRFVANAAHQLRTPLTLLRTQAHVGLREQTADVQTAALVAIDATVDRIARLSTQLLALARAEQGSALLRTEPVDFAQIAQDAVEALAEQALLRAVDLGFEGPGEVLWVRGHAPLLGELVHNLVENAIFHAGQRAVVNVTLERRCREAHLRVEDNGPGIPAPERSHVFERFYRLPGASTQGTGLGLAIVREIVTSHDGQIILEDRQQGPGLSVRVVLPLLDAPPH